MKDWQFYALAALAIAGGWYLYTRRASGSGGENVPETVEIGDAGAGDFVADVDGGESEAVFGAAL